MRREASLRPAETRGVWYLIEPLDPCTPIAQMGAEAQEGYRCCPVSHSHCMWGEEAEHGLELATLKTRVVWTATCNSLSALLLQSQGDPCCCLPWRAQERTGDGTRSRKGSLSQSALAE